MMAKVKFGADGESLFFCGDNEQVSKHESGDYLIFHCPGCQEKHVIPIKGASAWAWNGSMDAPTLSPSILVRSRLYGPEKQRFEEYEGPFPCEETPTVCHSFVVDGNIQFLNDCTHSLAGQMVDLPDWLRLSEAVQS